MLKKTIAFILATSLILTLIPTISFAVATVPTEPGTAAAYPWMGTNVPEAGFYLGDTNEATITGTIYNNVNDYSNMKYQATGIYGKSENDASYYTYDNSGRTETSISDSAGRDYFKVSVSNDYATSDAIVEFSFAYDETASDNTIIDSKFRFYNTKLNNIDHFLKIAADSITFGADKNDYNFEPHKWYTITLVCDLKSSLEDTTTLKYKAYVNGELIINAEDSTKTYLCLFEARLVPAVDSKVYWDNISSIKLADASTFIPTDASKPTLASANTDITINNNIITVPSSAKVSDVKAAVNNSLRANDTIRLYNSNYSVLLADTDFAAGAVAVIESVGSGDASYKGTFTYYDIQKSIYRFTDLYDGSNCIINNSAQTPTEAVSVNGGIGGKKADDYYISVPSFNTNYGFFGTTADVYAIEFSLYIPSNVSGAQATYSTAFFDHDRGADATDYVGYDFGFNIDGDKKIRYANAAFADMPLDEWVNFAIVAPKVRGDNDFEFYMNGKHIYSNEITRSNTPNFEPGNGFRHGRFANSSANIYLDNIRKITVDSGLEYLPQYDKAAVISTTTNGIDTLTKTITVADDAATVQGVVDDIKSTSDIRIAVYDADNILVTDYTEAVADDYKFVIAANNDSNVERAYSYYTVRVVDGEIAFDTPYIDYDEATGKVKPFVKVYNYTENAPQYKVYFAVYKNNELTKLFPRTLTAAIGTATGVDDIEYTLGTGESVKLFIWDTDGITPVMPSLFKE